MKTRGKITFTLCVIKAASYPGGKYNNNNNNNANSNNNNNNASHNNRNNNDNNTNNNSNTATTNNNNQFGVPFLNPFFHCREQYLSPVSKLNMVFVRGRSCCMQKKP